MAKNIGQTGSANEPETGNATEAEGRGSTRASEGSTSTATSSKSGGRGGRGGSSKTAGEEKESPIVSLVEAPPLDPKEEERRKKRAEAQRLRRQKAKEKEGTKPATSTPKKSDAAPIKALLMTGSMILASKEGMEHWALTDREIKDLADPLSNILAKYEAVGEIAGKYADHIALVIAAFTILFPRIMKTFQNRKNQPKEVKVHARQDRPKRIEPERSEPSQPAERETPTRDRAHYRPAPAPTTNVSEQLSQQLPAIGGF